MSKEHICFFRQEWSRKFMAMSREKPSFSPSSPHDSPASSDKSSGDADPEPDIDYELVLTQLLRCAQEMFGQTEGVVERLVQEIERATGGRMQIRFTQASHIRGSGSLPVLSEVLALPIQLGGRYYGELLIRHDLSRLDEIPWPVTSIQQVALTCAVVLYTLEAAAFLQVRRESPAFLLVSLTRREHEVMTLMCRGEDDGTIAASLHISPATVRSLRERVYNKLHVHNKQDAIIAAFTRGLYSPLDHLSPQVRI
jgi:DNA-binding CsgD family transcriptional regulator